MMYLLALIIMAGLWLCGYKIGTIRARPRKPIPLAYPYKDWEEWVYRPLDRRRSDTKGHTP